MIQSAPSFSSTLGDHLRRNNPVQRPTLSILPVPVSCRPSRYFGRQGKASQHEAWPAVLQWGLKRRHWQLHVAQQPFWVASLPTRSGTFIRPSLGTIRITATHMMLCCCCAHCLCFHTLIVATLHCSRCHQLLCVTRPGHAHSLPAVCARMYCAPLASLHSLHISLPALPSSSATFHVESPFDIFHLCFMISLCILIQLTPHTSHWTLDTIQ